MTAITTLTFTDVTDGSVPMAAERQLGPDGLTVIEWRSAITGRPFDQQVVCRASLSKPNGRGLRKVVITGSRPRPETLGAGAYDYVAPPKVAYSNDFRIEFWISARADRLVDNVSALNLLQAAVLQANIVDLCENMALPS